MKISRNFSLSISLVSFLVISLVSFVSCSSPSPQIPHLRITNRGPTSVINLTVLFPDEEICFGDIPAGATTEYQGVSNGVFRYAAYRYEIDGKFNVQSVIDWVGEKPLVGNKFTYLIEFSANRPQWERVRLVEVTLDE